MGRDLAGVWWSALGRQLRWYGGRQSPVGSDLHINVTRPFSPATVMADA